jgi:phosphoglucomutase
MIKELSLSVWSTDKDGLILGLLAAEITARRRDSASGGQIVPLARLRTKFFLWKNPWTG